MRFNLFLRRPTWRWFLFLPASVAIGALSFAALADVYSERDGVPRLIPFRGHLEQGGAAVGSSVSASFSLFDAATGGARVWGPEEHTFVPSNGEFTVMLGETVPLSPALLQFGDAYVAVEIEGELLQGRQRLGAVPFALRAANGVPTGSVIPFAAESPPVGWALCDGRALDGDAPEYAELYRVLGTTHGDGTGGSGASADTDFNLPDLRGQFLRGAHGGPDPDGDRAVGSTQGHLFGSHAHAVNDPGHGHPVHASAVGDCACSGREGGLYDSRYAASFTITANTTGVSVQPNGGAETRPVNVAMNFIIKL